MFFANNVYGERIHIDNANVKDEYFCPACGSAMIQKRGNLTAHHFAHKMSANCDSWYTEKLSAWHKHMQSYFKESVQEVIIWDKQYSEYHIADIALQAKQTKIVIEFQHSAISQNEFLSRSKFYLKCGYQIIWVFDFYEGKNSKKIYIADKYEDGTVQLIWPGRDRVKFLDQIDFSNCGRQLFIFFHVNTGQGIQVQHDCEGFYQWKTWEYVPFCRQPCFISIDLSSLTDFSDFFAKYYTEDEFHKKLNFLNENYG